MSPSTTGSFVERGLEQWQRRNVLGSAGPSFYLDQLRQTEHMDLEAVADVELDGRGQQVLVGLAAVDLAQAVEIT